MRKKLLMLSIAIVVSLGVRGSFATAVDLECSCPCDWICSDGRCEFECSGCSVSQAVTVSDACCKQKQKDARCGFE